MKNFAIAFAALGTAEAIKVTRHPHNTPTENPCKKGFTLDVVNDECVSVADINKVHENQCTEI